MTTLLRKNLTKNRSSSNVRKKSILTFAKTKHVCYKWSHGQAECNENIFLKKSLVSCRCKFDNSAEILSTNNRTFSPWRKTESILIFLKKKDITSKYCNGRIKCSFANRVEIFLLKTRKHFSHCTKIIMKMYTFP